MKDIRLEKIVPEANQRRYYHMHIEPGLFGDWGLVREWGRIGQGGQRRTDWFIHKGNAAEAAGKLTQQKVRRGYHAEQ